MCVSGWMRAEHVYSVFSFGPTAKRNSNPKLKEVRIHEICAATARQMERIVYNFYFLLLSIIFLPNDLPIRPQSFWPLLFSPYTITMVLLSPILCFYNILPLSLLYCYDFWGPHLFVNTARIVKSKNQQIGPLLSLSLYVYMNWHHQFYIWMRNNFFTGNPIVVAFVGVFRIIYQIVCTHMFSKQI